MTAHTTKVEECSNEENVFYWVYILHCINNTYYTGYTTDIHRRYQEHLSGSYKCKYTRSFKPTKLAQCWQVFGNKGMALKVENFIKQLSKSEKEQLILNPHSLENHFHCKCASFSF